MDWENLDLNTSDINFSDPNLLQELNLELYPDLSKINDNQEKYDMIKDFFTQVITKLQYLDTERETLFSKLKTCEDSQIYRNLKIDFIKALYRSAIVDHQREQAFEYLKNNRID
ncbi:hypothetical protein [Powai lake megavirus]|uniref:Uncharacterized protein n=1 Tax=Powai lake megavirus TaxID=1842663 RepID=A0A160ERT8_9VIRU|nr:hypothetical protein QJ849_gp872 [Powai lake megavirus]ANB51034.1 hypothetical protein [Powai lake megavirus]